MENHHDPDFEKQNVENIKKKNSVDGESIKDTQNNNEIEEIMPIAVLEENSVIIEGDDGEKVYENGYFGNLESSKKLILEAEEAILLVERKRLRIISKEGLEFAANDLVNYFINHKKNFWANYLVYKDLRNRGYIIRPGFGESAPYRLYDRGSKPGEDTSKIIIFPLPEGQDLELCMLDEITSNARRSRKRLILGVVDRIGDVTFYSADQLKLERNQYLPVFFDFDQALKEENNESV